MQDYAFGVTIVVMGRDAMIRVHRTTFESDQFNGSTGLVLDDRVEAPEESENVKDALRDVLVQVIENL